MPFVFMLKFSTLDPPLMITVEVILGKPVTCEKIVSLKPFTETVDGILHFSSYELFLAKEDVPLKSKIFPELIVTPQFPSNFPIML